MSSTFAANNKGTDDDRKSKGHAHFEYLIWVSGSPLAGKGPAVLGVLVGVAGVVEVASLGGGPPSCSFSGCGCAPLVDALEVGVAGSCAPAPLAVTASAVSAEGVRREEEVDDLSVGAVVPSGTAVLNSVSRTSREGLTNSTYIRNNGPNTARTATAPILMVPHAERSRDTVAGEGCSVVDGIAGTPAVVTEADGRASLSIFNQFRSSPGPRARLAVTNRLAKPGNAGSPRLFERLVKFGVIECFAKFLCPALGISFAQHGLQIKDVFNVDLAVTQMGKNLLDFFFRTHEVWVLPQLVDLVQATSKQRLVGKVVVNLCPP